MKRYILSAVVIVGLCVGYVHSQQFENVATADHEGKTGLKDLVTELDANFALIESGTVCMMIGNVTNNPGTTSVTNYFRVTGTQLLFVTQGRTNVIDSDILN